MQIALLGPLEVTREDEPVHVPRGKASEVLARLALEPGVVVSAERLVEDLWVGGATMTRRNTLQSKVAMLRRAVGDAEVVSRDGGYALSVAASQVDALVALRHTTTAVRLRGAAEAERAGEVSASALALYRGQVLHVAGDADWATVPRTRLEEARLTLLEVNFWARIHVGDVATVIGELEAAAASYPFQESLWELLITALYRAGRQADALTTYQRVRQHLADELGLDPGLGLQQLEQRILVQDPSIGAPLRVPGGDLAPRQRGNLPRLSAGLMGRESEVSSVRDLLTTARLVDIVGPGGVGKTALALEVGRDLSSSDGERDGVWLARLEAASSESDVVDALVAALGVPGEAALLERISNSEALVILDNCEHVLDAVSALALRLLDMAPALRILCTSQVPLGIDGEQVFELTPLALARCRAAVHRTSRRRPAPGGVGHRDG